MGGWSFAHTIGLIQRTKVAHCVEEMWAIVEMNSNWKVWMASLVKSKHTERQIIFCSRLFALVLVGFSYCVHVSESCQLLNYCSGSFLSYQKGKGLLLSTNLAAGVQTNPLLPLQGLLSPSRLSRCCVSTVTEAWSAPSSQALQYEWPYCLVSLSPDCSEKHIWLAAPYKSIHPGTHTHIVNSDKLQHSLQSSSGLFEFFQSRDGKVKGHRQRGSNTPCCLSNISQCLLM